MSIGSLIYALREILILTTLMLFGEVATLEPTSQPTPSAS